MLQQWKRIEEIENLPSEIVLNDKYTVFDWYIEWAGQCNNTVLLILDSVCANGYKIRHRWKLYRNQWELELEERWNNDRWEAIPN